MSSPEAPRGPVPARVAVVIVGYNSSLELRACLASLYVQHPGLEPAVTVVDNASRDDTAGMLEREFPAVRLIRNQRNRGFAAACNQGLARLGAEDRLVLVLNPDVRFDSPALELLQEEFAAHPEAGALTPRVLGEDRRLQRGCRRRDPRALALLGRLTGLSRLFPRSRTWSGYSYGDLPEDLGHEVEAASGCFLLIRREALAKVGGFDERFFMYAEDLDWCRRLRAAGWTIRYCPRAAVIHRRGASTRRRPLRSLWHLHFTASQYLEKYRGDYPLPLRAALHLALAASFCLRAVIALAGAIFLPRAKPKEIPRTADNMSGSTGTSAPAPARRHRPPRREPQSSDRNQ